MGFPLASRISPVSAEVVLLWAMRTEGPAMRARVSRVYAFMTRLLVCMKNCMYQPVRNISCTKRTVKLLIEFIFHPFKPVFYLGLND